MFSEAGSITDERQSGPDRPRQSRIRCSYLKRCGRPRFAVRDRASSGFPAWPPPARFPPFTTKERACEEGRPRRPPVTNLVPNQWSNCTVTVRVSGLMVKRNRFVTVPMGGGAAPPVPPPLVPWGTSNDCVL